VNRKKTCTVLVHLASGIGNIVLATPLLRVLDSAGFTLDVLLDTDYPGVGELLEGWSAIRAIYDERTRPPDLDSYDRLLAAVPPFYWRRFAARYALIRRVVYRPADDLFYNDEQGYYIEFARWLGCDVPRRPHYFLPICPDRRTLDRGTLVMAPGCKTGEMATKRWPFFAKLAEHFDSVSIVGTKDDIGLTDGRSTAFPKHVRSYIETRTLKETAEILAGAGAVVANDSGLGHIAGAVGVPTFLLFGPTSDTTLGPLPVNVRIIRRGLACEPCWFAQRFRACAGAIRCLHEITVEEVAETLKEHGLRCRS
jgi:ADP-heptose:LPS heptosyltransferase